MNGEDAGSDFGWMETDPHGVKHRVVVAPRGTLLRPGSVTTGLWENIVELLLSTFLADGTYKVGVLRRKWGIERFVLKERFSSEEVALARAAEVRAQVRRGDLGPKTG